MVTTIMSTVSPQPAESRAESPSTALVPLGPGTWIGDEFLPVQEGVYREERREDNGQAPVLPPTSQTPEALAVPIAQVPAREDFVPPARPQPMRAHSSGSRPNLGALQEGVNEALAGASAWARAMQQTILEAHAHAMELTEAHRNRSIVIQIGRTLAPVVRQGVAGGWHYATMARAQGVRATGRAITHAAVAALDRQGISFRPADIRANWQDIRTDIRPHVVGLGRRAALVYDNLGRYAEAGAARGGAHRVGALALAHALSAGRAAHATARVFREGWTSASAPTHTPGA